VLIGEGCQIGAGSVVVTDIPPYTTAIGIPAKAAGKHRVKEHVDLNHHLMPDPVKEALDQLMRRIEELEEKVDGLGLQRGRAATAVKGSRGNR